ncbi:zf-HC2 domain-containing protein [bacterium]|nr:zf-HC2 domain-containing protein [candidate division CSSED10-310 bacterium]
MNGSEMACAALEAYHDGELVGASAAAFEAHLAVCGSCRRRLAALRTLGATLRDTFGCRLPEDADLRIRRSIHRSIAPVPEEILDLEGVAALLRIPVHEVVEILDSLPAFELCGRLRFRRDKVLAWMGERERRLTEECADSTDRSLNIIYWQGGAA